jgi:hypothetical protein
MHFVLQKIYRFFKVILYFLMKFHLLFEINICYTLKIDADFGSSFVRNVLYIK